MSFESRTLQILCLTILVVLGQTVNSARADQAGIAKSAVPFPPLVTDIVRHQAGQIPAQPRHANTPSGHAAGAASGAGGFPAQPSAGYSFSGGALTTLGVVAVLGGIVIMMSPDGSTGNSSSSATN